MPRDDNGKEDENCSIKIQQRELNGDKYENCI